MKILLLAAGRSKRMKPVKDKNFLNFLGKPLIWHQLKMLADGLGANEDGGGEAGAGGDDAGGLEVILVAGEHNLAEFVSLKSAWCEEFGMKIEIVEQEDLDVGMCGAVLAAKEAIGSEPVLIFSSNDVVEKKAFELIVKASKDSDASSYLLGKKVESYFPGGYLEVDEDGFIKKIIEKPLPGTEPSDLINLVVHYHRDPAKLIDYLEKSESENDDLYEIALDKMIGDGVKMKAVEYDGFWQPVKFPWHVQPVFLHLFGLAEKRVHDGVSVSENATLNGDVIIEDGVKIFDGAVVNGPAYIGRDSVVATNALVRESHIGEKCVVGYATEIARSFLGSQVWTHSNYIGDSVIGNNVSFGAGAVTGNLRLDEGNIGESGVNKLGLITGDHVRFGVNVSTMPGVSVGSNSVVGPGVVLSESIGDNKFVKGRVELEICENKFDVSSLERGELSSRLNKDS